jgi:hypothetical protein
MRADQLGAAGYIAISGQIVDGALSLRASARRQVVFSAQTQAKVARPVYHGCQMVTSAIDALAHLITGSPRYFHAQGTLGEPGEPNWTRDRQDAD